MTAGSTRAMLIGAALVAIGAPRGAAADPDLRLHHAPPRLRMRAVAAKPAEPAGTGSAAAPAPSASPAVSSVTAFSPLPTSGRDLAERVTFRLRAGVELEGAPASGELLRGGAPLPPGFADARRWIVGDAMVGARDILLPSLGGYFLSSLQFDAGDTLATRSALVVPGDAADQRIAIKAGYVEWGNDDRRPQPVWLRAGRQFRLDGGAMFAYFDGLTAGYRKAGVDVSAFAGQRVALYVGTERGATFGATGAVDLRALGGVPARLAVDYMGLAIHPPDASTGASPVSPGVAPASGGDTQLRQLIALTGSYEPSARLRAELRARIVDGDGHGLALGRVGGRVKLSPSDRVLVIADVEQRQGGDLAYDLAAPSAVDVVDVARKLGVGLAAPIDALTVGGRVDLRRGSTELLVFGRAELPEATPQAVDQAGWIEGGAAVAGQAFGGAWLTAQYTGRQYRREAGANLAAAPFADTAGSGLDRLHEIAVDATLRSQLRGVRWRAGVGGFYRIYNLVTPYRTADDDGRGGGRAELSWWLTRALHVDLAAELAQGSPVLAREIGTMSSLRGTLEARW